MTERAAAALIHEFAALRAEGEIVRPFAARLWTRRRGAAVFAFDASRAKPNAVFRLLLGVIGAADAEGMECPRALIAGQHVLLKTANFTETALATNPIFDQLERRLQRGSSLELKRDGKGGE